MEEKSHTTLSARQSKYLNYHSNVHKINHSEFVLKPWLLLICLFSPACGEQCVLVIHISLLFLSLQIETFTEAL